jgi:hypothetical protein
MMSGWCIWHTNGPDLGFSRGCLGQVTSQPHFYDRVYVGSDHEPRQDYASAEVWKPEIRFLGSLGRFEKDDVAAGWSVAVLSNHVGSSILPGLPFAGSRTLAMTECGCAG